MLKRQRFQIIILFKIVYYLLCRLNLDLPELIIVGHILKNITTTVSLVEYIIVFCVRIRLCLMSLLHDHILVDPV